MEIIVFSIPFVVALFLLIFFRKETVWWEYALLIVPSVLIALIIEACMISYNTSDTEYLGNYITKIRHYDKWNEYIHRTCTKQVPCGTDSKGRTRYRTVAYDCSYVDTHPERWTYFDRFGHEDYFYNEEEFNKVKDRFKAKEIFIEMNRHYYTIDGDAQEYVWDGDIYKAKTLTDTHSYENKIQASRSIFKLEDISEDEAKELGLYDYPKIIDYDQNPILGITFKDRKQEDAIRWINGKLGYDKQFRMFILFYKNKGSDIVDKQRSYWQGGNKNELIVCVGLDNSNKVTWCNTISWSDEPVVEVATKNYFISNPLNLVKYAEYITPIIQKSWSRKEFDDFKYISIELSDTQYTWLIILVLLYNIGISIYIITNDYRNEVSRADRAYRTRF